MATNSFTMSNAEVFIATRGVYDGIAARLCCTSTVTFTFSEEVEDYVCNPSVGIIERLYKNPSVSIEMEDQNFNSTSLRIALNASSTSLTDGYKYVGNGNDPNTTPTSLAQVDGPFTPDWGTDPNGDVLGGVDEAIVNLDSAFIIDDSVVFWTYDGSTFTVAVATVDYAHAQTDTTIGQVHVTCAAVPTTLYATYKHYPLEDSVTLLQNAFSTSRDDYTIVVRHTHSKGEAVYDFIFWKVKADMTGSFPIHDSAGGKVNVPMKFQSFADTDKHLASPIIEVAIRPATVTATPLIECGGDIVTASV